LAAPLAPASSLVWSFCQNLLSGYLLHTVVQALSALYALNDGSMEIGSGVAGSASIPASGTTASSSLLTLTFIAFDADDGGADDEFRIARGPMAPP
jgi:hypothetical protein